MKGLPVKLSRSSLGLEEPTAEGATGSVGDPNRFALWDVLAVVAAKGLLDCRTLCCCCGDEESFNFCS